VGLGSLPLDDLLGVGAHDADLAELTEVICEGVGIAQLTPQLRR
jgi:hypothetical protein